MMQFSIGSSITICSVSHSKKSKSRTSAHVIPSVSNTPEGNGTSSVNPTLCLLIFFSDSVAIFSSRALSMCIK